MAGIRVKAKFEIPVLDFARWERDIATTMRENLAKAVFAWISAATAPIPSWSGASLATFQPLASEIGYQLNIYTSFYGKYLGLGPAVGVAQSEGKIEEKKGVYQATYATSLRHLIYNEYNNANVTPDPGLFWRLINPGPYQFQEKGKAAAEPIMGSIRPPKVNIKRGKVIRVS